MRIAIAAALLVLLSGCAGQQSAVAPAAAVQAPPAPTWKTVELTKEVEEARKEVVRNILLDPESARFSDLYAAQRIDGNGGIALCGFVNAKNSYGGYTGKKRFFALEKIAGVWDDSPKYGYSGDNEMIRDICIRR